MSVWLSLETTVNSQSVANNTSAVTVKVNINWNTVSWTWAQEHGELTIDGTTYGFDKTFNGGQSSSGSETLITQQATINHNSDGTKTLSISAWFNSGTASGKISDAKDIPLEAIPRASLLTVEDGELEVETRLTITKKVSRFRHTLVYVCGDYVHTVLGKSSTDTTVDFTPPMEFANTEPTRTSVTCEWQLTTYDGESGPKIGSTEKRTATYTIPESVLPEVASITVTDKNNYAANFGGFVKGQSAFHVKVTPRIAYSSRIKTINTKANGKTYTTLEFDTDTLANYGDLTVKTTLTDQRGRSVTDQVQIPVQNYSLPQIRTFNVHRCRQDGTEDQGGGYAKVTYSHYIYALQNNNAKSVSVQYRKAGTSAWSTVPDIAQNYTSTNAVATFAADDGSSYDIKLTVSDSFGSAVNTTALSTAYTLMHFAASGKGLAIGKVSEKDALEINMDTEFHGDLSYVDDTNVSHAIPYVVASSFNDTGYSYIKYSNGQQIAWYKQATASSKQINTASGNMYYKNESWTMSSSIKWAAVPTVHIKARATTNIVDAKIKTESIDADGVYSVEFIVWCNQSTTVGIFYDVIMFGRWK